MRRFVLCLTLCYFVLVFFSPFSIAITSHGEEKANLSFFRAFVRFVLVWICLFSLSLGVWEGLRFVIVALPGLFSYLFCESISVVPSVCPSVMLLETSVGFVMARHRIRILVIIISIIFIIIIPQEQIQPTKSLFCSVSIFPKALHNKVFDDGRNCFVLLLEYLTNDFCGMATFYPRL